MKQMKQPLCIVVCMSFMITVLLTCIDVLAFQSSFFQDQYHELQIAETMGMSEKDLMKATTVLLDYLHHDRFDIHVNVTVQEKQVEMFNEREIAHMVDVKNLYQTAMFVRNIACLTLIVSFLALWIIFRRDIWFSLSYRYIQCTIFMISVAGMLGLWIAVDFSTFWTTFHHVFFRNDLWLLNPITDRMIQMFPEPFFFAMVSRIAIAFVLVFGLLFILSLWYYHRKTHQTQEE